MKKYLLMTSAILLLAVACNKQARVLPAQNQTDETANWKTYRNIKYGFEFKYPADFKDFQESGQIIDIGGKGNLIKTLVVGGAENLFVQIYFSKFGRENIEKIHTPIFAAGLEKVDIGGREGYKFGGGDAGCGSNGVQTALMDLTLELSMGQCEGDVLPNSYKQIPNLFEKIISTFKFIK